MLTLIHRELRDHFLYVVLIGLVSLGVIAIAILTAYWGVAIAGLGIGGAAMALLLALFAMLGVSQMYTDRAHRISALVATLATTRTRILAARILTAVVLIIAMLVPLLVTAVAIMHSLQLPLGFFRGTIAGVFVTSVLTCLAGYCVGLLTGWTSNRALPAISVLVGTPLVMLLVAVKGFGWAAIGLLSLFIIASLFLVWRRFTSVAL